MSFIWSIESFETLPSTQDKLKDKIKTTPNIPEGFVVHTEDQTNGYGRHGRSWKGGKGNLYISFLLKPQKDPIISSQISLVTGLALTKAVKLYIGNDDGTILKWPNDVLIDNKKCAGILIEAVYNNDNEFPDLIVGVGVNITNCPFENTTFLNAHAIIPDTFQDSFLDIFSDYYSQWHEDGFKPFQDRFIRQTYAKDSQIGVKTCSQIVTGKFKNIDSNGSLELLCDETKEMRKITSGDVFLM